MNFGYVFRLFSGDTSLDMVSNLSAGRLNFVFVDRYQVADNIDFDGKVHLEENRWYHVRVEIPSEGDIICTVDSVSQNIPRNFTSPDNLRLCFGWNDDPVFFTTDVPPVTVRDIRLCGKNGIRHHWPLAQHNGDEVYDVVSGERAVSRNGEWVMDAHCVWSKVFTMYSTGLPMVAYDQKTSRLFVSASDSMTVCDLGSQNPVNSVPVKGTPVRNAVNQMFYDSDSDRLLSYSMHNSNLAEYDFNTCSWSGSFDEVWPPLTGHGKYFDQDSSVLFLFGGYGNHRYNADFTVFDIRTGERTVTDLSDQMYPRYFGSFCVDDNGDFIVLGGFGSRSGLQEEFPMEMNDIFRIDRETFMCTSLGRFSVRQEPLMFSSSMVYDSSDQKLYTLTFNNTRFNTSFSLVSPDTDRDTLVYYASPVDFSFHDTDSFAELVFSRDSSSLYAIAVNAVQNGTHRLDIWKLSYPPIPLDEILQTVPEKGRRCSVWYIVAGLFLAAAAVMAVSRKRKSDVMPSGNSEQHDVVAEEVDNVPLPDIEDSRPVSYTVVFLGSFRINDRNGNDITGRFSSKMRSLFQYLVFRTAATGETVTTDEISDVFWFGMDRQDATNSRNVYFRKLRSVFSDIGAIGINVDNNLVSIKMGSDVNCDYLNALKLLESIDKKDSVDPGQIADVLRIVSAGSLLPGYEYEWIDKYKAAWSELLVSVLMKATTDKVISGNSSYLGKIADIILREDCLDEFAIKLKCRTLYYGGHKGMAQAAYDKWYSDYIRTMNDKPELSYYDDIIKASDH